jgi:hypothetical protein
MEGKMEKVFVVKRVAEKLWASEEAIDGALKSASTLMVGLVEAREELGVPHLVTDAATSKIAEAMALLAQARHAMIESHSALHEARLRIGVRTKLQGPHDTFNWHRDTVKDEAVDREAV